ncbi:MAG: hypothetical protein KDB10_03500 [Acidimicrobiales bacterium]|nr:hypothetical protein [Acidimicrobiales bacterium]
MAQRHTTRWVRAVLAAAVAVLSVATGLGGATAPAGAAGSGPLTGAVQVAAGATMSCAVLQDGTARCWGTGPLGTGGAFNQTSTLAVVVEDDQGDPLTGVEQIAVGGSHVCARLADATAVCWGENLAGELGDGTTDPSVVPVAVQQPGGAVLTGVTELALGDLHSCARMDTGEARCWGQNQGTLGDGTRKNRTRAVLVRNGSGTGPLGGVAQVVAGAQHTCALLTAGTVRCFGENGQGQLGDGTTTARLRPKLVKPPSGTGPLTNVTQLAADLQSTCARLANGQARCWGPNASGQRGNGTVTPPFQAGPLRPTAVKAPTGTNLTGVRHVGVAALHACVGVTSGQARCWGLNTNGQVGDGTRTSPRRFPQVVRDPANAGALPGVEALVGGDQHTCALLEDTSVACWGANALGQVGNGATARRKVPTPVQLA